MKHLWKTCLLAGALCTMLLAVSLTGCSFSSGGSAGGRAAWDDQGAPILKTKVEFDNPYLARNVEITNATSSRVGDLMMAQVAIHSKTDATLNLLYKIEWYDLNGMALSTASATWKPLLIYGREIKSVQGVAPDPRGREYKLLLRTAE